MNNPLQSTFLLSGDACQRSYKNNFVLVHQIVRFILVYNIHRIVFIHLIPSCTLLSVVFSISTVAHNLTLYFLYFF